MNFVGCLLRIGCQGLSFCMEKWMCVCCSVWLATIPFLLAATFWHPLCLQQQILSLLQGERGKLAQVLLVHQLPKGKSTSPVPKDLWQFFLVVPPLSYILYFSCSCTINRDSLLMFATAIILTACKKKTRLLFFLLCLSIGYELCISYIAFCADSWLSHT